MYALLLLLISPFVSLQPNLKAEFCGATPRDVCLNDSSTFSSLPQSDAEGRKRRKDVNLDSVVRFFFTAMEELSMQTERKTRWLLLRCVVMETNIWSKALSTVTTTSRTQRCVQRGELSGIWPASYQCSVRHTLKNLSPG